MIKLNIITVPNPRLKIISSSVTCVDQEIRSLMLNMLETMYASNGIGLAAIQVDVPKRVIVVDVQEGKNSQPLLMANPEIVSVSKQYDKMEEGCLSVPNERVEVSRPSSIKVKYLDHNNNTCFINADGLLATCIQHEIDHLNGIVILDKKTNAGQKDN